jgi:hypothetical protein
MTSPRFGRAAVLADGQASVEVVALLPLVVAVAAAAWSAVAAEAAREQAGAAAEAGAVALLQDADARAAARAALPDGASARIRIAGREVRVRVEPRVPLPGVAGLLAAEAAADAGPEAAS